ncbi:ABC transporter permease [Streptomyces sp. NPDC097727]|uniref:ABC transporter permease n=1 Tax=Streptomyces sp. NPDC097727 TaxID=3366092 RepID=UPI003812E0B7
MFRTALRNVLAHKARLLMTVLAVVLGVAFVSGTLVYTSTVSDAYERSFHSSFEDVDVAIRPGPPGPGARPGAESKLTSALLNEVAKLPGVQSVTGAVSGFTAVAGKNGALLGQGRSSQGANYYPGADGDDARYPMDDGRGPAGPDEIALDAATAERAGYKVGDTVRISVDGPVREEKLVGVFTTDDGEVAAGGSLTLFDTRTAQQLLGSPGAFSQIDVKAAPGTSPDDLQSAVDKVLPKDAQSITGQTLTQDQALSVESRVSSLRSTLLVFAGIALFVGTFLIANTFTMLVAQRTKELALLRAVGATRRQVTRSVLIEAFLVGLVASAAGLTAGIGVAVALRPLTAALGSSGQGLPDGPLAVTPAAVVTSFAIGICVTMLAAWLPARRAAKIPPVAAMSSVHAVAAPRSLVVRNTVGALVATAGIATVLAATTGMNRQDGQNTVALGGMILLTGTLVLTPLLSRPFLTAAAPVLRIFGTSGTLARRNALRNPRRTAATASALTIGLTLITSLTVIAVSTQQGIDKMATAALKADYVIEMGNYDPLAPAVEEQLKKAEGVSALSPLRVTPARVDGNDTYVTGVDATTIGDLVRPDFTGGSFTGFGGHNVVIAADTATTYGWHKGTTLPVTYQDGKHATWTVTGIYQGTDLLRGIITDTHTLDPHLDTLNSRQIMVKTTGGPSHTGKQAITKALGESPAILVQSKQDVSATIAGGITMMLNILYGLLAMTVLIAVLGIVNTLAMSVFERASEIGMLRAIGLDQHGTKRMVRLESLAISLFGGALGIALGLFLGWAGGHVLATDMPTYELVLPWGRIALALALAAVIGALAALWPAHRAAKLNPLTAIRTE